MIHMMEGMKDLLQGAANGDVEPGLNPNDAIALLEARIQKADPDDPDVPGMLRQLRHMRQQQKIARAMMELNRVTSGEDTVDHDYVPRPGGRDDAY